MTIQVLISGIAKTESNVEKILNNLPVNVGGIGIIQTSEEIPVDNNFKKIELYYYNESGLSRSRNRALDFLTAEIGLIADDDVSYLESSFDIISRAFIENPEYDIITFQIIDSKGIPFKYYSSKKKKLNILSVLKVSSIEIAFRTKSIQETGLKFDERFGLGTNLKSCEENIFLTDCIKKGMKILYIPKPIVMHPLESSGSAYNDVSVLAAKGAMFRRVYGLLFGFSLSILFIFRKLHFLKEINRRLIKSLGIYWGGFFDKKKWTS